MGWEEPTREAASANKDEFCEQKTCCSRQARVRDLYTHSDPPRDRLGLSHRQVLTCFNNIACKLQKQMIDDDRVSRTWKNAWQLEVRDSMPRILAATAQ